MIIRPPKNFNKISNVVKKKKKFKSSDKKESLAKFDESILKKTAESTIIKKDGTVEHKYIAPKAVYFFSKGESKIKKILQLMKVSYVLEKQFSGCVNPKTDKSLRFDFYLPKYNLCIEYDGIQHLFKIKSVSQAEFKNQLFRDKIKNEYCKKNNIQLLRIPSKDFSKLDEIIKAYLSKLLISNNPQI